MCAEYISIIIYLVYYFTIATVWLDNYLLLKRKKWKLIH